MAHRLAEEVDVELDDICLYIAKQSGRIEIADRVAESITDCFVALGRNPYMVDGATTIQPPACGAFAVGNYVIVYCIEEEDAGILHVFQGRRDVESFFR